MYSPFELINPRSRIAALATAGGSIAVEGTKMVIDWTAPWAKRKYETWRFGKALIVLGPPRAGKTSFMDFLVSEALFEKDETDSTTRVDPRKAPPPIKLGEHGNLRLLVKAPIDTPGKDQLDIDDQMEYIEDYKPHCIVVVLPEKMRKKPTGELRNPTEELALEFSKNWLSVFCSNLDNLLQSNARVAKKLQVILVGMNMWDEFDKESQKDSQRRKDFEEAIDPILEKVTNRLKSLSSYHGTQNIPTMPCVLVKNKLESKYVVEVLERIANLLVNR